MTKMDRIARSARWWGDAINAIAGLDPSDSPERASELARRVVRATKSWEHWSRVYSERRPT